MDGLERDLTGKAMVMRLDVTTPLGRRAAANYGVRGTPTLIVVDGEGEAVLTQVSLIRPGAVKSQVDELLAKAN